MVVVWRGRSRRGIVGSRIAIHRLGQLRLGLGRKMVLMHRILSFKPKTVPRVTGRVFTQLIAITPRERKPTT